MEKVSGSRVASSLGWALIFLISARIAWVFRSLVATCFAGAAWFIDVKYQLVLENGSLGNAKVDGFNRTNTELHVWDAGQPAGDGSVQGDYVLGGWFVRSGEVDGDRRFVVLCEPCGWVWVPRDVFDLELLGECPEY